MQSPSEQLNKSPKRVAMPAWGMVVFECRHAPGFFGEMTDGYAKFHLLIAGDALWESGGRKYSVTGDTLFHIAANVPHRQRDLPGKPVTLYAVHYRPEILRPELTRKLAVAGMRSLDLHGTGVDQARRVRALVQEMLFEQETQRRLPETHPRADFLQPAQAARVLRRGEVARHDAGDRDRRSAALRQCPAHDWRGAGRSDLALTARFARIYNSHCPRRQDRVAPVLLSSAHLLRLAGSPLPADRSSPSNPLTR